MKIVIITSIINKQNFNRSVGELKSKGGANVMKSKGNKQLPPPRKVTSIYA